MKSAKNENDNCSAMFCDVKVHFEASNSRLSRGLPSAAICPPTMTFDRAIALSILPPLQLKVGSLKRATRTNDMQ